MPRLGRPSRRGRTGGGEGGSPAFAFQGQPSPCWERGLCSAPQKGRWGGESSAPLPHSPASHPEHPSWPASPFGGRRGEASPGSESRGGAVPSCGGPLAGESSALRLDTSWSEQLTERSAPLPGSSRGWGGGGGPDKGPRWAKARVRSRLGKLKAEGSSTVEGPQVELPSEWGREADP